MKQNNGPAYSKYVFIKYINSSRNKYNCNDIAIIIDGDDSIYDIRYL